MTTFRRLLALLACAVSGLAVVASAQAAASLTQEVAALNVLRKAAGETALTTGGALSLQVAREALTAEDGSTHNSGSWRAGQLCMSCEEYQVEPGSPDFLTPQTRFAALGGTGTLALALLQGPLSLAGEGRRADGILLDPRAVSLDLIRDSQGMMMLAVVIDPSTTFTRPVASWSGTVDPALTSGVGVLVPSTVKGAGSLSETRGSALVRLAAQDAPGSLYAHVEETVGGARFVSFGDAFDGDLQLAYGARYHFRVGSLDLPFATRTLPAHAVSAGFRFDANVSAAGRAEVRRYLAQATPLFRRMVAKVDGLTTIQVATLSACGGGSSGCETWDVKRNRYLVTFAPGVLGGGEGRYSFYFEIGSVLAATGFDSTAWNAWQALMRRESPVAYAHVYHTIPLAEVAADQFAYFASGGAPGAGGYGDPVLCPAGVYRRWLAANWKLRPPIEQNPLAPVYLRFG
jgi:hypothetical protein